MTRAARLPLLAALAFTLPAPAEWISAPGHRFTTVSVTGTTNAGFTTMAPVNTGVRFTNSIPPERHHTNQILLNGSGVAAGDVDGDGLCDLFFAGLGGRSALYRNLGHWRFEDTTHAAGLDLSRLDATGTALADFDGDGDLDLVVNTVGQGTHCFSNDGRGRFASPAPLVLNEGRCGSSLALADVESDGTLDLYVANYRTTTIRDMPASRFTLKPIDGQPQAVAFGGRPLTEPDLTNRFAFRFQPAADGRGGGSVFHDELGEPDALYRNRGGGRFEAVPFTGGAFLDARGAPLAQPPFDWGLSVMLRDFNGDGAPDLYVCNDFSTPDRFWINDGAGRFRAAPDTALRQTSLSTMAIDVADIDRDGLDDFFTADMLSRERWRRLVQRNEPNANLHLFADVVGRPQAPRNTLQWNRGDGTYAEIAQLAGLEGAEWAWASVFLDVDLDGFEDLLVANGFERDYMNMDASRQVRESQMRGGRGQSAAQLLAWNRLYPRLATANAAFRNLGGLRFEDASARWGFDVAAVSQGMCLADLDNDGDLDAALNNSNDAATLLRNDTTAPRVAVRLRGRPPNTRGIGAKIELLGGAVPRQSQEMIAGGRYLSSDDPQRVFAAGTMTNCMTLVVTWRNGARSTVTNAQANRTYDMDEATSSPSPPGTSRITHHASRTTPALFIDASHLLNHRHHDEPGNEFERQPLLPRRLGTLGPGVSWFDADGDGRDDLIVAGGRGGKMALLRNEGRGRFAPSTNAPFDRPLARAQTAVLGWRAGDGPASLLAGLGLWDSNATNAPVAQPFDWPAGADAATGSFPTSTAATGPMALGDVDGDGTLELFIGGRLVPGRWPEAGPSMLFRRAGGGWQLDTTNSARLAEAGLVSGAVFTDLDGVGDVELVLACEWGPLRLLQNEKGKLMPWDPLVEGKWAGGQVEKWETNSPAHFPTCPLSRLTGWWNGVAAGDFDGDGRMDLIASNGGRNTRYERHRSHPVRLYHGDFAGDGSVSLLEAVHDEALRGDAPIHSVWTLSRGLPWLLEKFPSYEAFSRVNVEAALGDRFRRAARVEAAWFDTTVFLNRGDRFEARPLPVEAQFAPAFGVSVADFDGDGAEDVFLAQNFFGTRLDASRHDAGRGLLLRGDGRGEFAAMAGPDSGLLIYGEQRGSAAGDFDGDGRVDLAVAQHGGETKLYRNTAARPGLRVRLEGPPGNPTGVGARLRLETKAGPGPARDIHAGSGYWSQDSAVQVMPGPREGARLRIRWPGGRVTTVDVPPGAAEVAVDFAGGIRKLR